MSAFRRKGSASQHQLHGCRSWPAGSFITSSGIPSLDTILRGGLALGTVCLVESDAFGIYSRVLEQCFISQGVLQQHKTIVVTPDAMAPAEVFVSTLPAAAALAPSSTPTSSTTEDGLTVAWQYEKYLTQSGESRTLAPGTNTPIRSRSNHEVFCKSVDLNRRMPDATSVAQLHVVAPSLAEPSAAAEAALARITQEVKKLPTGAVLRVVVCEFGSAGWGVTEGARWCVSWLARLKAVVAGQNCVCMLSTPHACIKPAINSHVRHLADCVLDLMAFSDASFAGRSATQVSPDEFNDKQGLLYLRKLAHPFALCPPAHPSTVVYAFKRDRRKLVFSKLHLPPDESATKGATSTVASDQAAAQKNAQAVRSRDRRGEILSATTLVEADEDEDEDEEGDVGQQGGGAVGQPGMLCATQATKTPLLDF